ncbi:MAG: recombination regulator RecX [Burkholderiales bacterium]|nr:recombination regulator RecX [Burkholderiales bacterium]
MSVTLKGRAVRLLARRERSRAELERRLAPHATDAQALAAVLDELQAQGLLSEARLAEQVIASRRHRASAARIRHELARRGLDADTIATAGGDLDGGDLAVATALWQRRFGAPAADRAERERQLRFLLNRGFGRALALRVVRARVDEDAQFED